MLTLVKGGVTTVFVSHNLESLQEICTRVLWLDHGKLILEGEPAAVIAAYRKETASRR